jgi:ADP-ribose pyrophosphatase YjhB (NUDIX family)/GNAT superfamily N-acetyltransferase
MRRVALIVAKRDGLVLFGKRRDNGRWTLPGGHLNEGEGPEAGARRELLEETGLEPEGELQLIDERDGGNDLKLYTYECAVTGTPSGKDDPDHECGIWAFLDVSDGIPKDVAENMVGSKNPDSNVAASVFGLAKMAIADIPAGKNLTGRQNDYNHVLTPEHRAAGYTMQVRDERDRGIHRDADLVAQLSHKGRPVGQVLAEVSGDAVTPHSDLEEEHRGKGLGQAMYEALFAHAYHSGLRHVSGGHHSLDAGKVHEKLAAKHGLTYAAHTNPRSSWQSESRGSYDYALKSELTKREEDDEIDRLLMHPNPSERSMALKLQGVTDKHLTRGLADEDPSIQRQALRHPNLGHAGLLNLMQMPNRDHLQQLALEHPAITRAHVEALYHTHKGRPAPEKARMMHAISHHGSLDAGLIEKMVGDGNGDGVVENLNTPSHVIDQLVESHFLNPSDPHKKALARRALKHPAARLDHVERAFKESPLDVKMAVAQGPHLPEALAQDALMRGQLPAGDSEALLRSFIVQNPKATKRHLETAAQDRNPIVRHAAREKLGKGFQKFEVSLNNFLGTSLKKAIRPEDYRGIRSALDASGADLVDHKPDLAAHPPQNNADVAAYKQTIVDSANPVKRTAASVATNANISRKVVYQVPATHPTHGGARYMVKPYHERISTRLKGWSKHPHQGWAEMTNQALYHAGGIGHLHQNVHTAEHHMGEDHEAEPALVVKMDPTVEPLPNYKHGSMYIGDDLKHDARKVAMMDFLSNNLDRHAGNVMVGGFQPHPEQEVADAGVKVPTKLLALDHSRSFQYTNNHAYKWKKKREQPRQLEDKFEPYASPAGGAMKYLAPVREPIRSSDPHQWVNDWTPSFDWWGQNSDSIKGAMNKRLDQIKDPEVRQHIARNFDARAHYLDERANMGIENYGDRWWEDPVPQYRPGEKTDSEIETDNWQRQYGDK